MRRSTQLSIYTSAMLTLCTVLLCGSAYGDKGAGHAIQIGLGTVPSETISLGRPGRGALAFGIPIQSSEYIQSRPKRNYGTAELVNLIEESVAKVAARHPGTPKLHIGDLSTQFGGRLRKHISHQSGRDADVGYYLKRGHSPKGLQRTTAKNLDVPRTWTLMKSFLESDETEYLFSDTAIIRALFKHAKETEKVSDENLRRWFPKHMGLKERGKLRHLKGHNTHIHLRVYARSSRGNLRLIADETLRKKLAATLDGQQVESVTKSAPMVAMVAPEMKREPSSNTGEVQGRKVQPLPVRPQTPTASMLVMSSGYAGRNRHYGTQHSRNGLAHMKAQAARLRARQNREKQRQRRASRRQAKLRLIPNLPQSRRRQGVAAR
ncbi:MAG: penicillin-insensitive murein endopeptidase [Myxococcota bacterium]|nr:penicillin-insensitive murein endopeptidase [Myxococcota bacterium]